jgi:hypothetical protein
MANEFLVPRIVKADFTVLASAATQALPSGVFLPKGALITGITFMDVDAQTIADASGSIDLRVGSVALIVTEMIKNAAATQTRPYIASLVSTAGMYVPASGELVLSVQATSGSAVHTWSPTVYVGYVK